MPAYDDWGHPTSKHNHFHDPPGLTQRAVSAAKALAEAAGVYNPHAPRGRLWNVRGLFSVTNVLTAVWLFYVYRGERSLFRSSFEACEWSNWEDWPQDAVPHRLAFVADPQLVDPHTYPGRPWPLSTLTVAYTDQYLRRTFSLIQTELYPDTVIFLGDLFDGGREWTADGSVSEDKTWKEYGDSFWLREYDRFGKIFFGHWGDAGMAPRAGQEGRKILAGLPGNHDLGFAAGIRTKVRKRFNAYFGDGNRIDVIANHTFVSIDSVSLSALGHAAGSEDIWRPTQEFLDNAQAERKRAVARELRVRKGLSPVPLYKHGIIETEDLAKATLPIPEASDAEFPTILLTHVPLYRAEGTPCGPLREHWPPSTPPNGQTEPVNPDGPNAIAVRGGYQYQNVLTKEVSKDVADKIGNIEYAFSGDDHDYCEVVHRGYQSGGHGGIREITVKSLSWAMGVRRPGFVMISMWNPVDDKGNSIASKENAGQPTIQSHLCLLPDQLGTFIRYALLFGFTLTVLIIRAAVLSLRSKPSSSNAENPILPVTRDVSSAETEKAQAYARRKRTGSDLMGEGSSNSSTSSDKAGLSARSSQPRTRNDSPNGGYGLPPAPSKYTLPLVHYAGYYGPSREEKEAKKSLVDTRVTTKPKKGSGVFVREFKASIVRVASVVFVWYFWLLLRW